ncbi:hypothetical protein Q4R15_17735 [Morganella morganii]
MAKGLRNNNSTPSSEGTPFPSGENAQFQWILNAIASLQDSSESMHHKLDSHIDNLNIKIDSNHKYVSETIVEKNKAVEEKILLKHEMLEIKLQSNHQLLCEKIERVEPVILNNLNEKQKNSNRWVIGLLVTCASLLVAIGGVVIRLLVK